MLEFIHIHIHTQHSTFEHLIRNRLVLSNIDSFSRLICMSKKPYSDNGLILGFETSLWKH